MADSHAHVRLSPIQASSKQARCPSICGMREATKAACTTLGALEAVSQVERCNWSTSTSVQARTPTRPQPMLLISYIV